MILVNIYKNLFYGRRKKKRIPKEEKERIKNQKELEEYNKRQEKYNDKLRDESQKQKYINKMNKIKINTYTKKMVAIIISVCLIDLQFSYILAFLGKDQVAESLSIQLCTTILGVAFVYMIRAYFDTKAEKKNETKLTKSEIETGIVNKMSDILSNAGLNIIPHDFDDDDVPTGLVINKHSDDSEG